MKIRFTRGKNPQEPKPDTLTCLRDDGSVTQARLHAGFGAYHDLTHYAVETTLGYTEAFYGLVAGGRDIDSFGTKNGVSHPIPPVAAFTELITGLVQGICLPSGDMTVDEMLATLRESAETEGFASLPISAAQLAQILHLRDILWARWDALPPGDTMELCFPAIMPPD